MNNKIEIPSKFKQIIEKSLIDFIKIKTVPKKELTLFESKIGGIPYWPEHLELPKIANKNAKLIAQINFDDLANNKLTLEGYPTTGLLQFYAPPEDILLGLTFENTDELIISPHIKIVYHTDTLLPALNSEELINVSLNNEDMPFTDALGMSFLMSEEYLALSDEYSVKRKYKDINIDFDKNLEISNFLSEEINNAGSKIGGYAFFTQEDPRYTHEFDSDDWVLLLQIDSDDNLMFGDCGVANWFIKKDDLLNKDFTKVFFTWDCC